MLIFALLIIYIFSYLPLYKAIIEFYVDERVESCGHDSFLSKRKY